MKLIYQSHLLSIIFQCLLYFITKLVIILEWKDLLIPRLFNFLNKIRVRRAAIIASLCNEDSKSHPHILVSACSSNSVKITVLIYNSSWFISRTSDIDHKSNRAYINTPGENVCRKQYFGAFVSEILQNFKPFSLNDSAIDTGVAELVLRSVLSKDFFSGLKFGGCVEENNNLSVSFFKNFGKKLKQ
jgi:hypothetical protein